jgi:uncharacterized protein
MTNITITLKGGEPISLNDLTRQNLPYEWLTNKLSRLYRWGGETISVAYHSVLLHDGVPDHLKKAALLHDVAEIWVGEIPRPIKQLSPEIQALEDTMLRKVFEVHDVSFDLMDEFHAWDERMSHMEARKLFPAHSSWATLPSFDFNIDYLPPNQVVSLYKQRYIASFGNGG